VTELEKARNKGKRPAITPRANPEALLTTARMFGNHKWFGAFVKFPDLPKKIRFMIWHHAIERRRFLEVFLVRKEGVSISRDKWDDSRLLNYRSVCKDADTAILTKYHKIWRQDLLPIVAPSFQTVLFDYNADILHLTSYGAMLAALGKFGSSLLKHFRNVGFLFDHFGFWIKRYPDELAKMLAKLESVDTIVLEWRDRIWSEEIISEKTGKPKTIVYKYGKPLLTEQVERKEGMTSTYDWYDLLEKPHPEYHRFPLHRLRRERYKNMNWQVKAEVAFRCYIATQPKLYFLKNVRIWFLYPRSEHENRLLRPCKEMVSRNGPGLS